MNNIFLKNLAALATKNTELVKKLQVYVPTELAQLVQEGGAYNIVYKNKHIHNPQSPLGEAQEIFSYCKNEPVSIHLIYGLGLGYLFQFASLNSQGTVILYEPDLNMLWYSFTLVDFSKDILKSNVYITNTFDEVSQVIYTKSGMKNFPELLSLTSIRELYEEDFKDFIKRIQEQIGAFSLDLKYTKEKFYPSLRYLLYNIPKVLEEKPLVYFKDFYKGKKAVVVSAGPTLDRNIETLKKYRENYVLFTVGTAVKTLYKNDIKPDFICLIETYNSTKQLEGLDLSEVNFITEPYSHPHLHNFEFKNKFSHISANSPINHFWANICKENIEEYWSKGTVSYTALNCARLLGFSEIILVGQDLAYIEGQCYSKDSVYKDLCCTFNKETNKWEITAKDFDAFAKSLSIYEDEEVRKKIALRRLVNLNKSLYYVKGIQGDMVPTESVYSAFIKPLSEYTEHFNDRKYFNTSLVGAQIDGFENVALEDVLKDSQKIEKIELRTDFEYDKETIISELKIKLEQFKTAYKKIEEGFSVSRSLSNNLKRYNTVNTDILKELKKLSIIYLYLSSDFASQSEMYDYITTSEKIDLDYEMKMTKEFTVESINKISEMIYKYLETAKNRMYDIEKILTTALGKIE